MEQHTGLEPGQQFPILIEVVAEDEDEGQIDPVAVGMLGRSLVSDLLQDGYAVEPKNTGQRGGIELLFQVMTQIPQVVQAIGSDIYAQRDVINVISDLCTIFVSASPLAALLFKAHEKQAPSQNVQTSAQPSPIKITVLIDDATLTVEAADLKEAEGALKLAQRFHASHPSAQVTPQSQVKIRAVVPKYGRKH